MVRSAWIHGAGPGVAALALVGWLAATGQGAVDRPWVPPPCAGRATDAVAARVAQAPAAARAGDAPTLRLQPVLDRDGALSGQRLVIGRADGTRRRSMELAAESFTAGPFGQVVLVGNDDGIVSRVLAVDVGAACSTPLATSADVIRTATLGPDGRSLFEFRVDRASRADLGVWRRSLSPAADPVQLIGAIPVDAWFGRTWSTSLAWSDDGRRLAIQSCAELACRTRLIDPQTGATTTVAGVDQGRMVGVADGRLVSYVACRGLPCPIVAVDLATGARQTLAPDGGQAALVRTEAGPRLVHERGAGPRATLRSIALDGTSARDLGPLPDGLGLVGSADGSGVAAAIPAGWFLLAPTDTGPALGRPSLSLRHLSDGQTISLPGVTR